MRKTNLKNKNQWGANAVEYGLVMAVIVAMMLAGGQLMNKPIGDFFVKAAQCVSSMVNGGGGCSAAPRSRTDPNPSSKPTPEPIGMSETGRDFLKDIEQLRLQPYDDQTGKPITKWVPGATIGYGYLIPKSEWSKYKNGISESQAQALFSNGLSKYEDSVKDSITMQLKPHQFDALVLLAYNIGVNAFESSSVVKLINNPKDPKANYPTVEKAWKAFNKSQGKVNRGLVNRRNAEYIMYTQGVYQHW